MLQQLHLNGDDDDGAYAKTIRLWLESHAGRPVSTRRAITDPASEPSLR